MYAYVCLCMHMRVYINAYIHYACMYVQVHLNKLECREKVHFFL